MHTLLLYEVLWSIISVLVEKPKPITAGRSNSFDNVMAAPYLCGQWPKDGHWQQQKEVNTYCTSINNTTFTCEKQTQVWTFNSAWHLISGLAVSQLIWWYAKSVILFVTTHNPPAVHSIKTVCGTVCLSIFWSFLKDLHPSQYKALVLVVSMKSWLATRQVLNRWFWDINQIKSPHSKSTILIVNLSTLNLSQ